MGLFHKLFGRKDKDQNNDPAKRIDFAFSDKLMDEEAFWRIIHTTRDRSNGDFEEQQNELRKKLFKLSPNDIILYGNSFRHFHGKATTWELWGSIYIIHGGCSDDSFNDFREWVIAQGKEFYYKTINDPDSLADVESDKIEQVDWEGFGYIYSTVFEELTGQEMEYAYKEQHETTGVEWDEDSDDLKKSLPRLSVKYPDHN